jgi:pimeloyl-ACP methyl ester carboxylesterase
VTYELIHPSKELRGRDWPPSNRATVITPALAVRFLVSRDHQLASVPKPGEWAGMKGIAVTTHILATRQEWLPATIARAAALALTICGALLTAVQAQSVAELGTTPPGFSSASAQVSGTSLHYVRGGQGPAVILIHGFPEDWVEYRAIMPRLAKRFTVVAVDLPGIGRSAPANGGYDPANLAAYIRGLGDALKLEQPYVVGHDLGGLVAYAYARRFPDSLRGALVLDVPMPGIAGWDEAVAGAWHIGFIQTPGLAEKLVPGRQDAFLGWFFDLGKFTPEERSYYVQAYGTPQLLAAFEIYRALPKAAEWNAAQTAPNSAPLLVAVGEKSPFAALLPTFVEGYRARGMTRVESERIPDAGHYVVADNSKAVTELIERYGGR